MTKREQIRNVCINTELYIQNDPNYRGCIESGHFTERFDPLIKQLTSTPSEPEDELREETKQKLAEENKDSTWKGHSQGYYYHFIEGWDACIDYLKSKINTNN
jgi:hypothetical protein